MASPKLARELVLSGIALIVVFGVPFFPSVLTYAIVEFGSILSCSIGAIVRAIYVCAALLVAVAAWRKESVRLALLFLAMLVIAGCTLVAVNWG